MIDIQSHEQRSVDVFACGEALANLTGSGRLIHARLLTKSVGGSEANVAIGLARLGMSTAYMTGLGRDPFGDEVLRTLRAEGVDVSAVRRSDEHPTGVMFKERLSPDCVNVYYYRSGSAARGMSPHWIDELDVVARRVHVTGITLALGDSARAAVLRLIERARTWGAVVSFDLNFRLKLWSVQEAIAECRKLLPYVDDVLCSEAEAQALTGQADPESALTKIRAEGPARVVVRLGERGAVGEDAAGLVGSPGCKIECPLDSVGAGDAFAAGYLYELARGGSFEDALRTGNWAGAQVVAHDGDYEGLPLRPEYDRWRADVGQVQR